MNDRSRPLTFVQDAPRRAAPFPASCARVPCREWSRFAQSSSAAGNIPDEPGGRARGAVHERSPRRLTFVQDAPRRAASGVVGAGAGATPRIVAVRAIGARRPAGVVTVAARRLATLAQPDGRAAVSRARLAECGDAPRAVARTSARAALVRSTTLALDHLAGSGCRGCRDCRDCRRRRRHCRHASRYAATARSTWPCPASPRSPCASRRRARRGRCCSPGRSPRRSGGSAPA
jgi:hypothetical protein